MSCVVDDEDGCIEGDEEVGNDDEEDKCGAVVDVWLDDLCPLAIEDEDEDDDEDEDNCASACAGDSDLDRVFIWDLDAKGDEAPKDRSSNTSSSSSSLSWWWLLLLLR